MAVQIKYVICHYNKTCKECGLTWNENSDHPEKIWNCLNCGSINIKKYNHVIEVYKFANMNKYYLWDTEGIKTYYNHYYIPNIEDIFMKYDTLQWDNLFESFY